MKKVLDYFSIDGSYGGNQEWFSNVVMYIGGCGAATACDSCIYFARYQNMELLYPFDVTRLTKENYKRFSQIMKPYIRPRMGGVRKLEWYIDGLERYIHDVNQKNHTDIKISMDAFSGEEDWRLAREAVRTQIDHGQPVPYLMLKHQDEEQFKDFIWHWFLVVGYEETENDFLIIAATYGEAVRLPLKELWNTGYEEKGGLILYNKYFTKKKLSATI